MKLLSKYANLCDHYPPTSQTDRQTDGQTDRWRDRWTTCNHKLFNKVNTTDSSQNYVSDIYVKG